MHVPARTVPVPAGAASQLLVAGASIVTGWSWTETTGGASAELALYDGNGNNGALIADITLTQGESTRDLIALTGIGIRTGLYLDVVSGSIRGAVWVLPGEFWEQYELVQGERAVWRGDS